MDDAARKSNIGGLGIREIGLALVFGTLCAWPYVRWMDAPSLHDDDFDRVGGLRRSTLAESLFRPFNEHMAPLFEVVSWLSWQASGRQVLNVSRAFEVSSFLAMAATVSFLVAVLWQELRSATSTLIGLTVFALSAVSAETVLWYSASSFTWSASATLAAWLCASLASSATRRSSTAIWLILSAMASLAAPAFSAIGLLAGPMGSLRFGLNFDRPFSSLRQCGGMIVPMVGTLTYLLICQQFAYGPVISSSVRQHLEVQAALLATIEAPAAVLLPGLVGQGSLARRVSGPILAATGMTLLLAGLGVGLRSRRRPFLLSALALVLGGYLAAYATRARPGDLSIFEIQRYHLFPQIGIAMLVAACARPLVARFDKTFTSTLLTAVGFAAILAVVQYPRMQAETERRFRDPDQPSILAATLRLEAICLREGITLDQLIPTLDPIRAPWYPRRISFNPLLHLLSSNLKEPRIDENQVRSVLLNSLSMDDREAIFGGLDANRYRVSEAELREPRGETCKFVKSERMVRTVENQFRAEGRGSFLEFEAGPTAGSARSLILPHLSAQNEIEIWWAGADGDWTHSRSVRYLPDRDHPGSTVGFALDRWPHWRKGYVRKVRLIFREWGQITVEPPRFAP